MKKSHTLSLKWPAWSGLAFLITMIVNYGSMAGWFGPTQEEISNQYSNLITPASFTFSIWGVIYSLVLAFLVYQIWQAYKDRIEDRAFFKGLNQRFILTCLLNMLWNVAWVNDWIIASTVFIFLFTFVLADLNTLILRAYPRQHGLLIPLTFSLYLGWLTVATVTNVAALIVKYVGSDFGSLEQFITGLVYLAVAVLAFYIIWQIKNPFFNLPIVWAFVGIYAMLQSLPAGQAHPLLAGLIGLVVVLLFSQSIAIFIKNDKKILPACHKQHEQVDNSAN